jgi:4-azaleucine resistance transporter AzlC
MSRRADYLAGVRGVAPVMVGIVPFGLLAGAAAVEVGLTLVDAMGFSVFVFAGAAQLAAIGLIGSGAPLAIVVLTALIINVRMLMYSASIAPEFEDEPLRWRAPMAYILTDQAYALSITRFAEDPTVSRKWFYLGCATPLWVVWQVCTVVGALAGARVPAWLPLEFAVPLTFLAILVPAITDRPAAVAALVGGGVAVAGAGLPFNLGLLAGALTGIPAGVLAERWSA